VVCAPLQAGEAASVCVKDDYQLVKEPLLVAIDMSEIKLLERYKRSSCRSRGLFLFETKRLQVPVHPVLSRSNSRDDANFWSRPEAYAAPEPSAVTRAARILSNSPGAYTGCTTSLGSIVFPSNWSPRYRGKKCICKCGIEFPCIS
jgi:hypothetical protein